MQHRQRRIAHQICVSRRSPRPAALSDGIVDGTHNRRPFKRSAQLRHLSLQPVEHGRYVRLRGLQQIHTGLAEGSNGWRFEEAFVRLSRNDFVFLLWLTGYPERWYSESAPLLAPPFDPYLMHARHRFLCRLCCPSRAALRH
jgi:hypothetical protein